MKLSRRQGGVLSAWLATLAVTVVPAGAQTAPPRKPPAAVAADVKAVAEGWTALAQGDVAAASRAAERALAEVPRSVAAAALAVEVEIVRAGPLAGLSAYESWLGLRKVEDGYVLRRLARAHLQRASRQGQHPGRLEAVKALVADGDAEAAAELGQTGKAGFAETRMLASLGHPRAVQALIAELRAPGGSKLGTINALVQSGSKQAVPALIDVLNDRREDHRAAAADALGRLGASDAIPRIKPLLEDPVFPVRMAAASALYRLEDYSGVNMLEELLASEHPAVRLGAADAMAGRPAGSWHSVVRDLTNAPDATVQLGAARLIAPYDPELAAAVIGRLQQSENMAIREEAGRILVQQIAGDFGVLRRYLRATDPLTSIRAAARILELTR